jgi:hypothetical protein
MGAEALCIEKIILSPLADLDFEKHHKLGNHCLKFMVLSCYQYFQTVRKISLEHPTACLSACALIVVLLCLDFFSTGVQMLIGIQLSLHLKSSMQTSFFRFAEHTPWYHE